MQRNDLLSKLCRLQNLAYLTGQFFTGFSHCFGTGEGSLSFPRAGWDEHRMEKKFYRLAEQIVIQPCARQLADMVWEFGQLANVVRELAQLLQE